MKINIELSAEEVEDALREYLERRGFTYVEHLFEDGIAKVIALPKAVPAAGAAAPQSPRAVAPAVQEVVEVQEVPALSFAELRAGPSSLFDDDDSDEVKPSPTREPRIAPVSPVLDELALLLAQNEQLKGVPAGAPKGRGNA